VEAVAVGGHDAEIGRQRGEDNEPYADAESNGRKNGRRAAKRGERPMRMAEVGCSAIQM